VTHDTAPELLAAYDEQVRRRPHPDGPDDVVEQDGGVVRVVSAAGGWSGVTYADLTGRDPDAAIAAQIARIPGSWEWKHHAHDEPPDLPDRLLAAGFVPEEPETLMVADLEHVALEAPDTPGVDVRAVGAGGVADMVAVHDAVFGGSHAGLGATVIDRLPGGTVVPVVAYDRGMPVAAGRLELFTGTQFAGLYGDSTLPTHRGRGIFRALVAVRAAIARERGFRYLQADALETSRPLFARLGFAELTTTTPFTWRGSPRLRGTWAG
jgi:GNAT superfamily N-acetyltransferase